MKTNNKPINYFNISNKRFKGTNELKNTLLTNNLKYQEYFQIAREEMINQAIDTIINKRSILYKIKHKDRNLKNYMYFGIVYNGLISNQYRDYNLPLKDNQDNYLLFIDMVDTNNRLKDKINEWVNNNMEINNKTIEPHFIPFNKYTTHFNLNYFNYHNKVLDNEKELINYLYHNFNTITHQPLNYNLDKELYKAINHKTIEESKEYLDNDKTTLINELLDKIDFINGEVGIENIEPLHNIRTPIYLLFNIYCNLSIKDKLAKYKCDKQAIITFINLIYSIYYSINKDTPIKNNIKDYPLNRMEHILLYTTQHINKNINNLKYANLPNDINNVYNTLISYICNNAKLKGENKQLKKELKELRDKYIN